MTQELTNLFTRDKSAITIKQEIKKYLQEMKECYNFADSLTKNEEGLSTPKRAYVHEMRGAIQNFEHNYKEFEDYPEFLEEILPIIKKLADKNNMLEKIIGFKDFSKKKIISSIPMKIEEIANNEAEIYKMHLKNSNISFYVQGNSQIYLKPEVVTTFISTNFGNALKWAPNNTGIYLKLKTENNQVKINLENEFTKEPQREIGEGKGIGTCLTNKIISEINGTKEIYNKSRINKKNDSIYGIEFTLPKNPNLIN